jgi:tetratricopeptide (TPR) repeat protein
MLWPSGLNAFRVSGVVTSIADPRAVFSLAVLAAVFAALPFAYRHARGISFAVWWFFITLLPVSNIVPIRAVMAERFLYLPSIGFCLLAAICIERIGLIGSGKGDKPGAEPAAGEKAAPACGRLSVFARMAAVSVTAVLIIACSARTMIRNEDWKDAVSITRSILKIDPLNPWAFTSLGAAYSGQERHQEAVKPLLKAIALSGTYFAPRNILGFSYLEMGRFDEAIKVLEGALKINPDSLEALNSLGVAYASVGRYKDAVKQFERSIKIDGTFANAYVNLGTTYDRMGRPDKALEAYGMVESITRSKQDIAIACIRMGDVYMKTGRRDRAREYYAKAAGLCGRGMDELKRIAVERQRR